MLQDYLHWVSFRYLEHSIYIDLLKGNRAVGSCAMVLAEVCTFLKGRVKKNLNKSILLFSIICMGFIREEQARKARKSANQFRLLDSIV